MATISTQNNDITSTRKKIDMGDIDMDTRIAETEETEDYKQKYLDLKSIYDAEKKVFDSAVIVDTVVEIYTPSIFTQKPTIQDQSPPKTTTVLQWCYEDDDGNWAPVTHVWNAIVTAKFNINSKSVQDFTVKVGKFDYDISVAPDDKGYQTNTQTNKKRMIKCDRIVKTEKKKSPIVEINPSMNMGIPGIVYDETILKALKMTGSPRVIPIAQGTNEYMEIEGRFMYIGYNNNPSMISRGARITGIDRVLSHKVVKKYLLTKTLLTHKNERLLFHGCKDPSAFQNIFTNGLDSRESLSIGLLGQGIYMGDSPFYPHNGGFTGYPDNNGVRKMFVVACLVGSEFDAGDVFHSSLFTRQSFQNKKKLESTHHSIRAQTTDDNCGIYCVYDNSQCYVTHVISYIL